MICAVINARRLSFVWSAVPRNVANLPSPPRWRMRAGAHHNDNNVPERAA
jgi:hypothetical protein